MRDKNDGAPALVREVPQEPYYGQTALRIQRGRWLVGEDDARLPEVDLIEELRRPAARFASGSALEVKHQLNVLRCRKGREQIEPLEHEANVLKAHFGKLPLIEARHLAAQDPNDTGGRTQDAIP